MVPESTPREALYIESGLLDIKTITDKNRIMMGERIKKNGTQLLNEVTKNTVPGGWKELLRKTIRLDICNMHLWGITHQTGNVPLTFPEGYNQVSR